MMAYKGKGCLSIGNSCQRDRVPLKGWPRPLSHNIFPRMQADDVRFAKVYVVLSHSPLNRILLSSYYFLVAVCYLLKGGSDDPSTR
jgi:hypothetical protein